MSLTSSTALILAGSGLSALGEFAEGDALAEQFELEAEIAQQQAEAQAGFIVEETSAEAAFIREQTGAQALISEQRAEQERQASRIEAQEFKRQQRALFAEGFAAGGTSGIRLNTGTPLIAEADFFAETQLQASRIHDAGETTAVRLEQQAALTRGVGAAQASLLEESGAIEAELLRASGGSQAALLGAAGRASARAGFLSAGASLLTGAGIAFG